MKLCVAVSILLHSFIATIYCQEDHSAASSKGPLYIAVSSGMTLSKLSGKGYLDQAEPFGNPELSYITSVEFFYAIVPRINIRSGVSYARLGGTSDDQILTDTEGRELGTARLVQKQTYIEIPILLTFVAMRDRYRPYMSSGVTIGFLRATSHRFEGSAIESMPILNDLLIDRMRDMALGLNFSAGVQIPLHASLGLDIGGTYNMGLTNQLDTTNERSQKLRSWRFTLGMFMEI